MKHQCPVRTGISLLSVFFYICGTLSLSAATGFTVQAAPASYEETQQEQEERMSLPIQSNLIENWPEGPAVGAQGAILLEANTGVILYSKNIHEKLYPASTTKLMTCLLAIENSSLSEKVTFSRDAVFSIEKGSSNIGIDAGQAMPMEECLYGILVASANEVAAAVAEHIGGSQEAFASMMNDRAKELGCTDTHFVNAHGLFDENHYTSANDLALIAKAFFQNELLTKIGNTPSHHFIATADQPDDFITRNKHQLITGELPYEGIRGGKTGYTDEARQTLVTCAERNGMKLICVVMKEESPQQFQDTVKLLDYGFNNFVVTNVAENETRYNIDNSGFFHTSYDVFGNSDPLLSLNKDSYLILPKTADFDELTSEISYDTPAENEAARIHYYYNKAYVGTACINLMGSKEASLNFDSKPVVQEEASDITEASDKNIIFINIKRVLFFVVIIAAAFILLFIVRDIIINYSFHSRRKIKKHWQMPSDKKKRSRRKGPHFRS